MNKREIVKIPVMDAPADLIMRGQNPEDAMYLQRYMITAAIDRSKKILILHFFQRSDLICGNKKAVFRLFMTDSEYITQDLRTSKTKWLTGKTGNVLGGYWKLQFVVAMASDRDEQTVRKFFHRSGDAVDIIESVESDIAEKRYNTALDKERKEIDEQMRQFEALPADFEDFLWDEVMTDHYLFYNRKRNYCFCTRCRNEYPMKSNERTEYGGFDSQNVKHNVKVMCKRCGTEVTCRSIGYGRSILIEHRWAFVVQKHGEEIHTRIFSAYWDLRHDYRNRKILYEEIYRSVFGRVSLRYYELAKFHGKWEERWCRMKDSHQALHHCPQKTVIYGNNIPDVFQGTAYQYCMLPEYAYMKYGMEVCAGTLPESFMVDNYLELYQRRQWVESLIKLGCRNLVNEIEYIAADSGKKKLPDILGLSKLGFQILMQKTNSNPERKKLRIMQMICKELNLQGREDINAAYEVCNDADEVSKLENLIQYASVRKICNYMCIQMRKFKHTVTISDMDDHCKMLIELNYDIRENLFPGIFYQEHARISQEMEVLKDEKQKLAEKKDSIKIVERMQEMQELFDFQMNGLCVIAPKEAADLRYEGRNLHHCVGTYIKKVAKAQTNIFFIRKLEEPDISYFTIEINMDGNMIQCRGKNNCSMTDEVKEFAQAFTKLVKEYFEKKKETDKSKHKKAG